MKLELLNRQSFLKHLSANLLTHIFRIANTVTIMAAAVDSNRLILIHHQ